MTDARSLGIFQRKSLDQITEIPDSLISVYVVENHIWAGGGSSDGRASRQAETRTVAEFLVDPVRPFLNDIFRQMAAPYTPKRRDDPIGQGYWIQAEFGSGKSHLLSFVGALALGREDEWDIIKQKERDAGLGRRESLYNFYENGLAKKARESKGILVAVKTLVGQGGGAIGVDGASKTLTEYILDAVAEQFFLETGRTLPLYPTEILAKRFLETDDFDRYRHDLEKFLKDPRYFDDEEQEAIRDFLEDLQNPADPGVQRDCGQRLWDFYDQYLEIRPHIPMETEDVLKHMVQQLLDEGYAGLLLILDEVSIFMRNRSGDERIEDEKTLVVMSNRLAKVENLPVWTVCAAQQAIETKTAGVKNIIARERLDLIPLLNDPGHYYDIALSRVRTITDPAAVDQYYEDYSRSFSWPQTVGRDEFARFFPFYPPSIDVVRAVSYHLTTVRSALYFMLQTIKTQRKRQSKELITLWGLFDDVVEYEEDPSGTTKGIANIKTKWPEVWQAYETAKRQLDTVVNGHLKIYRGRCEKIIKTLFLYHVANLAPGGLGHEALMNAVMEWRDHTKDRQADLQDNLDHYETLTDKIAQELAQVVKEGQKYRFNPTGGGPDPREIFQKARAAAEDDELQRRYAWEALLALDGWVVSTQLMSLDLAQGIRSIFRDIAPSSQKDITVKWHGREISGRVYMRDLLDIAKREALLPSINSPETGLDYAVFISTTPAVDQLDGLVRSKDDPRVLFWTPDALTNSEESLLADFAAYRSLIADYSGREDKLAKDVLGWVQGQLRDQMGTIYRIVPDRFGRGRVAAQDHTRMTFACQGELPAILTPLAGQVLDATYVSKDLAFAAPAPFNDTNAVNVINGIVKVREIPRGAKPNRDISAAQNYGFALQIMRRPNDHKLDLSECRYTQDMIAWIEAKLVDSSTVMPVVTLYKNFMGIRGPEGRHYGLSRRLVQLYLLCLVREGRLRILLTGHRAPVAVIDYGNIASIDFRTAVLDTFHEIQRLEPPEGWEVLAPFAAVMLDDDGLRVAGDDAEIQSGVQQLLRFKEESQEPFLSLMSGLADLFDEIQKPNPLEEQLEAWSKFLTSRVDASNPITYLRHALDDAFGYHVYQDDAVHQEELDDFASRRAAIEHAGRFFNHRDAIRSSARYAACELPDDPALAGIRSAFEKAGRSLARLDELIESESRLVSELLDPAKEAIQSYSIRYLQAFDRVTQHAAEVRQTIEAFTDQPVFRALRRLSRLQQLGADPLPDIQRTIRNALNESGRLSPTDLTRSEIERRLHHRPHPQDCDLTLQNADEWLKKPDETFRECQEALTSALADKASLLHSDALRERLAQGADEPFISGLLDTENADELAEYLKRTLGCEAQEQPDPIALLDHFLKRLSVRKLDIKDFSPSKRTIERADVEPVTAEFRAFLLQALESGEEDELPVVELE